VFDPAMLRAALVGLWLMFWGGLAGLALGAIVGAMVSGDDYGLGALAFAAIGWLIGVAATFAGLVVAAIKRRRAGQP
jgi:hypothetical protein